MTVALALLNAVLLLLISGLHVYWATGGKWGLAAVVPEIKGKAAFRPGVVATLIVAVGLAAFAALHLAKLGWLPMDVPGWLSQYGLLAVGGIFFLRVIGDFRYVGFFKQVTDTPFARMDTAYYIPLCLVLSINAFWVAVSI